jgi:hypothetical protein
MNLDLRHFEQVFKPAVLKKALSLAERDEVRALRADNAGNRSFDSGSQQVSIKRKGDLLLSFSCTCSRPFCEHLCAVLFYLQRSPLQSGLRSGPSHRSRVISGLSSKKSGAYEIMLYKFTEGIKRFSELRDLDQKSALELRDYISNFIKKEKISQNEFYALLAVYSSFSLIFNLRHSSLFEDLQLLFEQCEKGLDKIFSSRLTPAKISSWGKAVFYTLRSNASLASGAAYFLVPRYLTVCRDEMQLIELDELLSKRKLKVPYSQQIDRALICSIQVKLRMEGKKEASYAVTSVSSAEYTMAGAQLLMCFKRADKAIGTLIKNASCIRKNYPAQYAEYLAYALSLSRKLNNKEGERFFLRERLLHSLILNAEDLNRFMALFARGEAEQLYDGLIGAVKKSNAPYTLEKLSLLLLHAGRVDELIGLLNREKNRFTLLQELALKMWPVVPENFLSLYGENLSTALLETSDPQRRERLMQTANTYLDQLPSQYKSSVLDRVRRSSLY